MARATHSVSHGRWFFEVEFVSQPSDSHIRIGWAQACSKYIVIEVLGRSPI